MHLPANPLEKYPPVPRYTSYPTAPHFSPLAEGVRRQWLGMLEADRPVSLYLHLPYCPKQCWYCGCHTRISRRYEPVTRYLAHLGEEIRLVAEAIGRRHPVGHIHFGGGSPSMLHAADFRALMRAVRMAFSVLPESEIAIELDPRTVNEAKIAAYAEAGVNRLSIGVQDFDPAVQAAINRQQPFRSVYATVRLAETYGLRHRAFDLVYGLPCQTLAGFRRTLAAVLLLRPDRIALFGYAHVPWMKKAMRLIDVRTLPDAALRCAMVECAAAMLRENGYVAVGLDHYALPMDTLARAQEKGGLRRNFQGYGTDPHDTLIGLGASAISQMLHGYVQNPPLIETYAAMLGQGMVPQQKGFVFTAEDRLRGRVIAELMCHYRVALDETCRAAGFPPDALDGCLPALAPLVADGLAEIHGRQVAVSPQIPQAVRLVCAAFDAYYRPQPNRHAQVA